MSDDFVPFEAEDISDLVWLPGEFAAAGMEEVDLVESTASTALDINVPSLKGYFAPVRPGQLITILGQTSMGKSLLMHYIEDCLARGLSEKGVQASIVHVSVEEPIEDMAMLSLARRSGVSVSDLTSGLVGQRKSLLRAAAVRVGSTPIIYIGESFRSKRKRAAQRAMTDSLNLTNVFGAIGDLIYNQGIAVAAIVIDYLQALPINRALLKTEPADQRRLQVRSDVYFSRRAAMHYACPVFMGVQAKQNLNIPIPKNSTTAIPMMPGMYDGEESASIAQRSDRMLSVWMPNRTYALGTPIAMGEGRDPLIVADNHFLIKVLKQRGMLPAGKTWLYEIDFETGNMENKKL